MRGRKTLLTPMMELSSDMVTCLALSTAVTTCCRCCKSGTVRTDANLSASTTQLK